MWRSPAASQWDEADEPGLLKLIVLIDDFWQAESAAERQKLSGEIRLQRLEYGLTPVARQRLAWETAKAEEASEKRAQKAKPKKARPKKTAADPRDFLAPVVPIRAS